AALMLGAEGAWLGTAFLASPESGYDTAQKQRVVDLRMGETVLSQAWDIAGGSAWPAGVAGRAARNGFSDRWHAHEAELREQIERVRAEYQAAGRAHDLGVSAVWAGEAAGMVRSSEPAGEIVRRIAAEAEQAIRNRGVVYSAGGSFAGASS
ncbi:MAG: NAD(P)H-dependent flavin oxidoreductase, partial [Dehalococcoidia bacterium]